MTGLIQRASNPIKTDSSDEYDNGLTNDDYMAMDLDEPGPAQPESKVDRHNRFIQALKGAFKQAGWGVSDKKRDEDGRADFVARLPERDGDREEYRSVAPHDFEGQDQTRARALTWISSVIMTYVRNGDPARGMPPRNPVEVQAAIADGKLIIAANNRNACEAFAEVVNNVGKNITGLLSAMAERNRGQKRWPPAKIPAADRAIGNRLSRHHDKVVSTVLGGDSSYETVLTALGNVEVADRGVPGMHAEGRIYLHNKNKAPDVLAGTKRPCVSCYLQYVDRSTVARPGPFYADIRTNADVGDYQDDGRDVETRAKALVDRIMDTGITATWDTEIWDPVKKTHIKTEEVGSDSETEGLPGRPGARRAQPPGAVVT